MILRKHCLFASPPLPGFFRFEFLLTLAWFALRLPETLGVERRIPFSIARIKSAVIEVCSHRVSLGYTISLGLISSAFLGYLSSAQQIFQKQYKLGTMFPLYFAILALCIGSASFVNGRLVMRFGMQNLMAASGLGSMKPNTVVIPFFEDADEEAEYGGKVESGPNIEGAVPLK